MQPIDSIQYINSFEACGYVGHHLLRGGLLRLEVLVQLLERRHLGDQRLEDRNPAPTLSFFFVGGGIAATRAPDCTMICLTIPRSPYKLGKSIGHQRKNLGMKTSESQGEAHGMHEGNSK